jgi:hypothetical protein
LDHPLGAVDVKALLLIPVCGSASGICGGSRTKALLRRENEWVESHFARNAFKLVRNDNLLKSLGLGLGPAEWIPRNHDIAVDEDLQFLARNFSGQKAVENHCQMFFKIPAHLQQPFARRFAVGMLHPQQPVQTPPDDDRSGTVLERISNRGREAVAVQWENFPSVRLVNVGEVP